MEPIRNFTMLDDAAVITLARLGDKRAYSELVKRHQAWIRNLLRRISGNAALADDLAQQVFLAGWMGLGRLRSAAAFPAWLRSLAVVTWLKQRRRRDPLAAADVIDDLPLYAPHTAVNESADIDRALALLSDAERLCIVLCYHEGLSHGEAAELADLPLGTVKSHVLRGRQKLQEHLAAYEPMQRLITGDMADG